MKNTLLILSFVICHSSLVIGDAVAQAVSPKTTAVMADPATGVVVWPVDFAEANLYNAFQPLNDRLTSLTNIDGLEDAGNITAINTGYALVAFADGWNAKASLTHFAQPYTLAYRDTAGRIYVGTPVDAGHAATKAYVDARTPQPVAARITIQLDAGQTDAELKLAIDNYLSGILVLWIHTPNPKGGYITGQIVPPGTRVYYTDSGRSDTRTHRALAWTSELGIAYQRSTNGQIGSIVFIIPVSATIRPDNPALAWVYHRMSPGGHEQDASGRAIWRIPDKVEWLTVMPSY
jgi:hypothetical protein